MPGSSYAATCWQCFLKEQDLCKTKVCLLPAEFMGQKIPEVSFCQLMPPTMKLPTLCGREWVIFSLRSTYKEKYICPLKTDPGACEMATGSIRSLYRNTVLFVHCLVWKENFLLKLVAKLRNEADTFFFYRCEKKPKKTKPQDCSSLCPPF